MYSESQYYSLAREQLHDDQVSVHTHTHTHTRIIYVHRYSDSLVEAISVGPGLTALNSACLYTIIILSVASYIKFCTQALPARVQDYNIHVAAYEQLIARKINESVRYYGSSVLQFKGQKLMTSRNAIVEKMIVVIV